MNEVTNQEILDLYQQRCAMLAELEERIKGHTIATDPKQVIEETALVTYLRGNVRKLSAMAHTVHNAMAIATAKGA